MTYNILTPETDTSCHFFGGISRNFQTEDKNFSAWMLAQSSPIMTEDKRIVEASQRMILHDPDTPFMPIKADAGVFRARRLIDQMLAAEANDQSGPAQPQSAQQSHA
jgi:vanillate O-demethylase monooxygenase subunit